MLSAKQVMTRHFSPTENSDKIEKAFIAKMNTMYDTLQFVSSPQDKDHFDFFIYHNPRHRPILGELKVLYHNSNDHEHAVVDFYKLLKLESLSGKMPYRIYFLYYDCCYVFDSGVTPIAFVKNTKVREQDRSLAFISKISMQCRTDINFVSLGLTDLVRV